VCLFLSGLAGHWPSIGFGTVNAQEEKAAPEDWRSGLPWPMDTIGQSEYMSAGTCEATEHETPAKRRKLNLRLL
jgi:hypothetical protein